jgi:hypothetical protein
MRAVGYTRAPREDRAQQVPAAVAEKLGVILPGAGLDVQRAAITDACRQRGWELGDVFDDALGPDAGGRPNGYAQAMHELEQGRAEVLIAAKLDTVCPWSELPDLLDRAERQGWGLLALDLTLDTLTADGRAALRSLGAQARALPPSALPMPPAELMFRVVGSDSPGRFEVGGRHGRLRRHPRLRMRAGPLPAPAAHDGAAGPPLWRRSGRGGDRLGSP